MTTSKKILWASYTLAIVLTVITVICTLMQIECSNLVIVCGAAYTELAVHTAVYSSKAKKENAVSISYTMIEKLADKYGIENVVQLLEIVNRE